MLPAARTRTLDFRFATMTPTGRIWCIPAVHGQLSDLIAQHDRIADEFKPGDRMLWLGNVIGHGGQSAQVIDEVLQFRRRLLSIAGVDPSDFIWLRGAQEEMLLKLFQLVNAPTPWQTYRWMLDMGLGATLSSYGIDWRGGFAAAYGSGMYFQRWLEDVKAHIWRRPGHDNFFAGMRRAAISRSDGKQMLFVSAGIDPDKTLDEQGDTFWWGGHNFNAIRSAYRPFDRVVRGFDPTRAGMNINCVTASLDDKCGFGGKLVSVAFAPDAAVEQVFD